MNLLLAVGVVVVFAVAIEWLDLPDRARDVGRRSRACLELLRDPTVGDDVKEEEIRRHALRLFALFGRLAGGSLLAIGLPLGSVWLLDLAGLASLPDVVAVLERVDFLVGATAVGGATYVLIHRARGP